MKFFFLSSFKKKELSTKLEGKMRGNQSKQKKMYKRLKIMSLVALDQLLNLSGSHLPLLLNGYNNL